jgi:hypothetical protein
VAITRMSGRSSASSCRVVISLAAPRQEVK